MKTRRFDPSLAHRDARAQYYAVDVSDAGLVALADLIECATSTVHRIAAIGPVRAVALCGRVLALAADNCIAGVLGGTDLDRVSYCGMPGGAPYDQVALSADGVARFEIEVFRRDVDASPPHAQATRHAVSVEVRPGLRGFARAGGRRRCRGPARRRAARPHHGAPRNHRGAAVGERGALARRTPAGLRRGLRAERRLRPRRRRPGEAEPTASGEKARRQARPLKA
jgi:hypothetical protein